MKPSLSALKKAFASLTKALSAPPKNDLERDGAIQRFEYTFELTWKSLKKYFDFKGIVCEASPRELIREAGRQGLIASAAEWLGFLKGRNLTSHTYNEATATDTYEVAKRFSVRAGELLEELEKRLAE